MCAKFPRSQLLEAASPEDDYQEPLNHRGEHHVTRNQIAMAQYECFQRIVKKTNTASETNRNACFHAALLRRVAAPRCDMLPTESVSSLSAGLECNTTWDGWLCWDETEAGITTEQSCPDYYNDFDPHGDGSLVTTPCFNFRKLL